MRAALACVALLAACSHHAAPPPSADAAFACGSCDPATQFCYQVGAGVVAMPDSCIALPDPCRASPSCTCVLANRTDLCFPPMWPATCTDGGGAVSVLCIDGI
jgi:hypothetical protein